MTEHDASRPPRFCSNCGAKNAAAASQCGVCGQTLVKREDHARLWGTNPTAPQRVEGEVIDLYPELDVSSQATTPFTQTRPYDPTEFKAPPDPKTKSADPWASGSMRLGNTLGAAPVLSRESPAAPGAAPKVATKRKGPPGCVLGCLAMVLIVAVSGVFVWGAVRGAISNRVEDELQVGISNELRKIDTIPVPSTGKITLTEDNINADLEEFKGAYEPIKNVHVAIDKTEVRVTFELYGVSSTYSGGLEVESAQIVVTNPKLEGPARQFVDAEDIAETFQAELAELLTRSGLQPVDVRLRDGSIVITTANTL